MVNVSMLGGECLNETMVASLAEANQKLENWKEDSNLQKSHSSIGYLTPKKFGSTDIKIFIDKLSA